MATQYSEEDEFSDIDDDGLLELINKAGIDFEGLDITQDPVQFGVGADASGQDATAVGVDAIANNANTAAFAEGAEATGGDATALGRGAIAPANWNTVVGYDAGAVDNGENVVIVGRQATATGDNGVAIGEIAQADANNATAVGRGTTALGADAAAFGQAADASGARSTAVGHTATVSADDATAVGENAEASGDGAVAIGQNTTVSTPDTFGFGPRDVQLDDGNSVVYPTGLGQQVAINKPADGSIAAGNPIGYQFQVDGTIIAEVYAESDGAGGIQNARLDVPVDLAVDGSTTEVDNVVTGDITIEDGGGVEQFRFDATVNPKVADFNGNTLSAVGAIDLSDLGADPTLESGLVWHRSDQDRIKMSPDGNNVQQIGWAF